MAIVSSVTEAVGRIGAIHQLAMAALEKGDQDAAEAIYAAAAEREPDNIAVLNNYALVLRQIGKISRAEDVFRQVLELMPNLPEAHYNLGNLYVARGDIDLAAASFEKAVSLRRRYPEAWAELGVCYRRKGFFDEAVAALRRSMELREDVDTVFQLGVTCHSSGRLQEARVCYEKALHLRETPLYTYNMGVLLQNQGNHAEAGRYFSRALALEPGNAKARNNLGLSLEAEGRIEEAEACFKRAISLDPDLAEAHNNLGYLCKEHKGDFTAALDSFRAALECDPRFARAWYNMATTMQELKRTGDAVAAFVKAINLEPDLVEAHWNYSHSLLLGGNYREGFREYLWRWRRPQAVIYDIPLPRWQGEEMPDGTLIVHTEQGAGDSIQFIRYLPEAARRVGKIILICEEYLVELFQASKVADAVIRKGEMCNLNLLAQYYCPLLDLPAVMPLAGEVDIPSPGKYLRPPGDYEEEFKNIVPVSGRLKVGVVWQGNPKHRRDKQRSIPYEIFRSLFNAPNTIFYSLSKDNPPDEKDGVNDLAPYLKSFAHTAAAVSQLDLVITVDTSVAHLAGALGIKTWLLLPYVPDWRWLLEREDTPWYKSMRLFRQRRRGDWDKVLTRVMGELRN